MYAETELIMFPYFNTFYQDFQQIDEFGCSQQTNVSQLQDLPSSLMEASAISDYYLGGGDLFNAPERVIQEPLVSLDPMVDLDPMSMISCGEDVISAQSLTMSDIDSSIENGQLLSDVFYECKKDILAKEGNETPLTEVLNITIPTGENMLSNGILQKSASSSCLRLLDCIPETPLRPNFLDFPVMDFGAVYGMRRAFSEGDIKTLGNINDNTSLVQSNEPTSRKILVMSSCTSEDRKEKLSRYWNKKSKRNFVRKIKYACRKALADNQPRVRGRFAKME